MLFTCRNVGGKILRVPSRMVWILWYCYLHVLYLWAFCFHGNRSRVLWVPSRMVWIIAWNFAVVQTPFRAFCFHGNMYHWRSTESQWQWAFEVIARNVCLSCCANYRRSFLLCDGRGVLTKCMSSYLPLSAVWPQGVWSSLSYTYWGILHNWSTAYEDCSEHAQ